MRTVLIVDDDANIRRIVDLYMQRAGWATEQAEDGPQALRLVQGRVEPYDLVILDLMLPGLDGMAVCRRIREESGVPIIMLTAKGQVGDRIGGLNGGADDYVVKPFDPGELTARAEAVARRTRGAIPPAREETVAIGNLSVDPSTRSVSLDGMEVRLPRREYELLLFLARRPNQVFSRSELIEGVWGWDFEGEDRVVDLYVKRLRQRLSPGDEGDWAIRTVWGVGYKLEVKER